jgi:hypothetical protein
MVICIAISIFFKQFLRNKTWSCFPLKELGHLEVPGMRLPIIRSDNAFSLECMQGRESELHGILVAGTTIGTQLNSDYLGDGLVSRFNSNFVRLFQLCQSLFSSLPSDCSKWLRWYIYIYIWMWVASSLNYYTIVVIFVVSSANFCFLESGRLWPRMSWHLRT